MTFSAITLSGPFFTSGQASETLRAAGAALAQVGVGLQVHDPSAERATHDMDYVDMCRDLEVPGLVPSPTVVFAGGPDAVPLSEHPVSAWQDTPVFRAVHVCDRASQWPGDDQAALAAYDEVWAASEPIRNELAGMGHDAHVISPAIEPAANALLPRRHFGLPDDPFTVLTYVAPEMIQNAGPASLDATDHAVTDLEDFLAAKAAITEALSDTDVRFVVRTGEEVAEFLQSDPRVERIIGELSEYQENSLIAGCDCLMSLHPSSGFERRLARSLWYGRPVVAMGLEYLPGYAGAIAPDTAQPTRHVSPEHIKIAAALVTRLSTDQAFYQTLRRDGQLHMRRDHSLRAVGLQMADRLTRAGALA